MYPLFKCPFESTTSTDAIYSKTIFFLILGWRLFAVRIISSQVILKIGLIGLGKLMLDHSSNEIKKVPSYPSVVSLPRCLAN